MLVGWLQQYILLISFLSEGDFSSDPPFSWLGGEVIGKDLNWLAGSTPTFRNFNPNLEEKLGFDPNKESAATGSNNGGENGSSNGSNGEGSDETTNNGGNDGTTNNGGNDGTTSNEGSDGTISNGGNDGTTSNGGISSSIVEPKKYYVMVSHYLDGDDNMWNLIRYNRSNNGTITLERKSPHYICEFESLNITGQKTETITTKLKTDLRIKVNFHCHRNLLRVLQVWWDYRFKGQKLLDNWDRSEKGGKRMTGLRIPQSEEDVQQAAVVASTP